MKGAADARKDFLEPDLEKNDCYKYAATRFALYQKQKKMEIMVSFEPCFATMAEWYKQLFGESEGKDNKGLYPSSVTFSTDLHSWASLFRKVPALCSNLYGYQKAEQDMYIQPDSTNFDGLNFLADQNMSVVNKTVMDATILAHSEGGRSLCCTGNAGNQRIRNGIYDLFLRKGLRYFRLPFGRQPLQSARCGKL